MKKRELRQALIEAEVAVVLAREQMLIGHGWQKMQGALGVAGDADLWGLLRWEEESKEHGKIPCDNRFLLSEALDIHSFLLRTPGPDRSKGARKNARRYREEDK